MSADAEAASSVVGTIAVLLGLNQVFEHGFGDFQINPYYARIINLIGINITLAVSLNLINGLAGQFSIGHAGFMAVGGYTATYLTVYHGAADRGARRQHARRRPSGASVVDGRQPRRPARSPPRSPASSSASRRCASRATTSPSSRSGFGEIIRVIILNIPAVGGATGFTDAIPITNFFWIFAMAILTIVIVRNIADVDVRPRARRPFAATRSPPRRWASTRRATRCWPSSISAALAGVAGGLSGQLFANPLNPQNLNFVKSIEVIVMIVLGGIGSITGAVFGATIADDPARGAADVRPAVSRACAW